MPRVKKSAKIKRKDLQQSIMKARHRLMRSKMATKNSLTRQRVTKSAVRDILSRAKKSQGNAQQRVLQKKRITCNPEGNKQNANNMASTTDNRGNGLKDDMATTVSVIQEHQPVEKKNVDTSTTTLPSLAVSKTAANPTDAKPSFWSYFFRNMRRKNKNTNR